MRDNRGSKPSDQLEMSNIEELQRRSQEIAATSKDIVDNAPERLEEAKNLYRDRAMKKKAIHDADSYSRLHRYFTSQLFRYHKLVNFWSSFPSGPAERYDSSDEDEGR